MYVLQYSLLQENGDSDVWNNKGNALGELERYEEAIACYNEAIKLNPGDSDILNNKGIALGKLGRDEEAIKCFDEARELEES